MQPLGTAQFGNLVCHNLTLLKVGVCRIEHQRSTLATVGVDSLLYLLAVPCDKAVGGIHNHLCRTVVLLEFEYPCPGITLGKAQDIADVRTAERVDALRIVAHDTYRPAGLCELPHNASLHIVGILKLIDKHITEAVDIPVEHLGHIPEEPVGIHQQVVKVHCIGKAAPLGITFVYFVG